MKNKGYLKKALISAYEKGYRITEKGEVYSPFVSKFLTQLKNNKEYFYFNVYLNANKRRYPVKVHRLVAYQKYKNDMFEPNMQVRHKDNNKHNNSFDNIILGTQSENAMDIPEKDRIERSIYASTRIRRFTDDEMLQIKNDHFKHKSYKKIMNEWDISSKGTLHYILNNEYQTKIKVQ